jgi:hypothetical protein
LSYHLNFLFFPLLCSTSFLHWTRSSVFSILYCVWMVTFRFVIFLLKFFWWFYNPCTLLLTLIP